MNKFSSALMAGLAGGVLLLAGSPAGASTTKATKAARPAASASPGMPANMPAGYRLARSAPILATNGTQTHGFVTCPGARKPSGGGALIESDALQANLNSSYPSGQSWEVDVNNTSGVDTTFTVYAICIAPASTYTIVSGSAVQGQMTTQSMTLYCPPHTVVTGGGAVSETASTGVNLTSSVGGDFGHNGSEWTVSMSNGTTSDPQYIGYAICRSKPAGYSIQSLGETPLPAGGIASDVVTCPGASVPIGGGGFGTHQVTDTALDMNSSYPSGDGWVVYENNGETTDRGLGVSVVCAGT